MTPSTDTRIARLFARLRPRKVPNALYHYTSGSGLLGIVESKSIWATSIRYLNDSREFALALEIAESVLESRETDAADGFAVGLYATIRQSLKTISHSEMFVSSFSEHGDQLSQWRGYCPGGNGYSVGFTPGALEKPGRAATNRILAACIYDEERHQTVLDDIVEQVLKAALRSYDTKKNNRDRVYRESYKLFASLLSVAATIVKHRTFKEEREWRLVSPATAFEAPHPRFRPGISTLVPFFEHPLVDDSGALALHRIVIGPTMNAKLARQALELLLRKHKLPSCEVTKSVVPYRAW
jgi:hypothetical protein